MDDLSPEFLNGEELVRQRAKIAADKVRLRVLSERLALAKYRMDLQAKKRERDREMWEKLKNRES